MAWPIEICHTCLYVLVFQREDLEIPRRAFNTGVQQIEHIPTADISETWHLSEMWHKNRIKERTTTQLYVPHSN